MFDICFSSFLEIHYLTCFLKAFKSLARFHLPGGGVVLTLLSLKRLFLERNVPGKFASLHYVPFLTQGMASMLSATFMEINLNLIQLLAFLWGALAPALQSYARV